MKLARLGVPGAERLALVDADGRYRDISGHTADLTPDLLADLSPLAALDPADFPLVEGTPRVGPVVPHVGKFICVGLNYADHAAEAGMPVPAEPILFAKATSAVCGPDDGRHGIGRHVRLEAPNEELGERLDPALPRDEQSRPRHVARLLGGLPRASCRRHRSVNLGVCGPPVNARGVRRGRPASCMQVQWAPGRPS